MAISITFPNTPETMADSVVMHLLPPRTPNDKETAELAARLGLRGPVVDEGSRFSIRNEGALLHHFHASDSIRWCLLPKRGDTDHPEALDVRDEAKLREIAGKFLDGAGLRDKEATQVSIVYGQRDVVVGKAEKPTSTITSAFVNFSYTFEGLPVTGPGAKAQVEIGAGGKPASCYRFWRNITRGTTAPTREKRGIISWKTAQKVFQLDPAFAQLPRKAEVIVERARLCYWALSPSDLQGALFPVYEMRGQVSTPQLAKTPFRRYVVAIDYTPDELKKYGVANQHFRGACKVL